MKPRDYLRLRAEIETDFRKKLSALQTVWEMSNPGIPVPDAQTEPPKRRRTNRSSRDVVAPAPATPASTPGALLRHGRQTKRDAVRQAIRSLHGSFTIHEVRAALAAANAEMSASITDTQLSTTVARLAEMDELHVVAPRSGNQAAIYSREGHTEGAPLLQ